MELVKGMYFLKELLKDDVYLIDERKRYPLLVLVEDQSSPHLNSPDEALLEKILQSVHINLSEIKILNVAHPGPENNYEQFSELPSQKVINFGADFKKINLDINLEKYLVHVEGQVTFLQADPLNVIAQDKEKKKALWRGLQQMFLQKSIA